ncbi:NADAR family protein [Aliikangiella coralliicola]|uniref:NADAR family protein n=1 Tax=Aliikangiella coralliicola TaxID=2592383 RepID=A0A545UES6_9GAMM|nr:NADAR family protein [Aliikangiella coralliicola]TQV87982.1 NADAR family protein [Aliikangiella coralliicola]
MKEIEKIRSKKELIDYLARGKKAKYLCFWGHTEKDKNIVTKTCFSQWYVSPFTVDNVCYKTAEHFMMAEKARLFGDEEVLNKIIESKHPHQAKKLGRQVTGFDNGVWDKNCFDIVVKGNVEKFEQNESLKAFLVGTGSRVLVEASPVDKIWGVGLAEEHEDAVNPFKWKGLNLLGFVLMEVRERLKSL